MVIPGNTEDIGRFREAHEILAVFLRNGGYTRLGELG
jgi:hypothetical protein